MKYDQDQLKEMQREQAGEDALLGQPSRSHYEEQEDNEEEYW